MLGLGRGAPRKRWRLEARYQIVAACFLATLTAYVERVGFSIAFTEMAKTAGLDESAKGTVLSAFYWGYALSQVRGRQMNASWVNSRAGDL
jgi:ACS family sodium-dependent inorganic phosphate cotransporter